MDGQTHTATYITILASSIQTQHKVSPLALIFLAQRMLERQLNSMSHTPLKSPLSLRRCPCLLHPTELAVVKVAVAFPTTFPIPLRLTLVSTKREEGNPANSGAARGLSLGRARRTPGSAQLMSLFPSLPLWRTPRFFGLHLKFSTSASPARSGCCRVFDGIPSRHAALLVQRRTRRRLR